MPRKIRIKIEDIDETREISPEEMKTVMGGVIGDCGMPRSIFGLKPTHKYPEYKPLEFKFPQYHTPS